MNYYQHVADGTNVSTWNLSADEATAKVEKEGGRIFGPYTEEVVVAPEADLSEPLLERPADVEPEQQL